MRPTWFLHAVEGFCILVALVTTTHAGERKAPPRSDESAPATPSTAALEMTPAVACRSIEGYELYEPLPTASLTSDEKLLVYYRPLNFRMEKDGETYRGQLWQEGQIRRVGEKAVLWHKERLFDYKFTSETPDTTLFMRNTISLKGLKPGKYALDIILHDDVAKGEPAKQSLKFQVVPAASE